MTAAYLSLLLADGRLPTGAHTQSAGVEPALRHGMRVGEVPAYLRVRLATVDRGRGGRGRGGGAGLGTTRVRRRPRDARRRRRGDCAAEVDAAWRVRTLSDALREASDLLGRSYLRTAAAVWDLRAVRDRAGTVVPGRRARGRRRRGRARRRADRAPGRVRRRADRRRRGAQARALRPERSACAGPPTRPSRSRPWSRRVADARTTDDIPAHSAPLVEEWGQHHRTSERRLFRA